MDRLFLDANVLFSAAYRENSGLARLWEVPKVQLLSSGYALEEAGRNLPRDSHRRRLVRLAGSLEIGDAVAPVPAMGIPDKDKPILGAAIACRATHLITGDLTHLGHLFGLTVEGVLILTPAEYLRRRR